MKDRLVALFRATLRDLDPAAAVRAELQKRRNEFAGCARVRVLAFGKAARGMAAAALAELRTLPPLPVDGLLVPLEPDDAPLVPLEVVPGGHPLPTAGSLLAGRRALELCATADAATFVLVLLSGGASAMCEAPLDPTVSLAELATCYRALIGSGAGIEAVNCVRKHLSATKGGRLAAAAMGVRRLLTLAVSDVPGDLAALGSGPTLGDDVSVADCRAIVDQYGLRDALPKAFRAALECDAVPPLRARNDRRLRHSEAVCLLDNDAAVDALARHAATAGFHVVIERTADELPAADAAALLLARLRCEREGMAKPVAVVAGGEVRVALPRMHGTGGRNQQFALECAARIAGEPITVLSCGTDGIDGNSPAAGACVDGSTVARARALGRAVAAATGDHDAFPLLRALGEAVSTGPTGTNVRDVRLLVNGG